MDKESNSGPTAQFTTANEVIAGPTDTENCFTLTTTTTRGSGKMTRRMGMVCTSIAIKLSMPESGKMINGMEGGRRPGRMGHSTMDTTLKIKSTDKEP